MAGRISTSRKSSDWVLGEQERERERESDGVVAVVKRDSVESQLITGHFSKLRG